MPYRLQTPADVLRTLKDDAIQSVDLRFTDAGGSWQCLAAPADAFALDSFASGIALGQRTERSCGDGGARQMVLVPDPTSAFLDPFSGQRTLVLICTLRDPSTGGGLGHDARSTTQKAEAFLCATDIGDAARFGVDLADLRLGGAARARVIAVLEQIGIEIDVHGRDDGTDPGGIVLRSASLTRMADCMMVCRYVMDEVASRSGMAAPLAPEPSCPSRAAAVRVEQSIWHARRPLFAGHGYAGTSALMRHYFAGQVAHAPALLAICASAAGRRARRALDAPVVLGRGRRHAAATTRSAPDSPADEAPRVVFRGADARCNPYLAFAALLMAGIDGFEDRRYGLDADAPVERLYGSPLCGALARPRSAANVSAECLDALRADHGFLLRGGVFTPDLIETHLRCAGVADLADV